MRTLYYSLVLLLMIALPGHTAVAQDYSVPDNTPAHIKRAVESDARNTEATARDAGRLPAQVLTLADLNEGDHVAEITTFGQYYTPMLVEAVGPTGKVEMYDMPYLAAFGDGNVGVAGQAFADERVNAEYHIVDYSNLSLPSGLDAVYNILYYHDLQGVEVDTAVMNSKIFAALKPGGKYVIVDHLAEDGSGWRDTTTIHRIGKEAIVNEISAAGFNLIVDSNILANPEDDRTAMVFSPGMRGGTDRALLIFQKPH
ncbi:MAG: class I SAM-dependent methyltransferase [Gammaproteobacteria bacterium]|jgi:predicted methyltransferase|nr:class I SAM-dependent methyltransferase [Gammaproteobacteria bacterium]MBT6043390.1 class I SAM-dependent methyltransferase [Gammaproteobacteria bacterium]